MTMMENNIKKEFIEFLKQNNALKEYKENFINYWKTFYPKDIIPLIIDPLHMLIKDTNRYHDIINDSFIWGRTPQGHDYWSILNSQWIKKLKYIH